MNSDSQMMHQSVWGNLLKINIGDCNQGTLGWVQGIYNVKKKKKQNVKISPLIPESRQR